MIKIILALLTLIIIQIRTVEYKLLRTPALEIMRNNLKEVGVKKLTLKTTLGMR